jgi:hydrogenase-4 component B
MLTPFVALVAVAVSSASFIAVAIAILLSPGRQAGPIELWHPSFINAVLAIRVDALSAFFLLIIGVVSIVVAWYAIAYTRHVEDLGWFYPPMLLFIVGMAGVVIVDDFFFFFVPWEFMTLNSYLLVIFHRGNPESLKAGFRYFVMTHAGALALFFGIVWLVVNGNGSFRFEAIAQSLPGLLASSPVMTHLALASILVGFLVKSGAFPFGMWWLPDAHPAAPSPASALLSGVMIKIGLYGILRVFFGLLPSGSWSVSWGLVLASIGVLSLFFGTLRALIQHDSKRLLAYHSIGQVGYMLLGFGIGLSLIRVSPFLAAIGLVGGLFHVLNHACFKALLFLNAGVFEMVTGERDLNRLGGLSRFVPLTAVCTAIASFSIAGLPPFNGFASKWLLYHGSIWAKGGVGIVLLLFGIVAIFISAVTLASFLKFMGATIWGCPSPVVSMSGRQKEGVWIGGSQSVLATICLALGLLPYVGVQLCYRALQFSTEPSGLPAYSALFGTSSLSLAISDGSQVLGIWFPLAVGAMVLGAFGVGELIRVSVASPRRSVAVWHCGSEMSVEETRFRADHYYVPFKRFVRLIAPELRIHWRPRQWPAVTKILNPDVWAYQPGVNWILNTFRRVSASRVGFPQVYPAWNLIGLAVSFVILFLLWWWGGSHNG